MKTKEDALYVTAYLLGVLIAGLEDPKVVLEGLKHRLFEGDDEFIYIAARNLVYKGKVPNMENIVKEIKKEPWAASFVVRDITNRVKELCGYARIEFDKLNGNKAYYLMCRLIAKVDKLPKSEITKVIPLKTFAAYVNIHNLRLEQNEEYVWLNSKA